MVVHQFIFKIFKAYIKARLYIFSCVKLSKFMVNNYGLRATSYSEEHIATYCTSAEILRHIIDDTVHIRDLRVKEEHKGKMIL